MWKKFTDSEKQLWEIMLGFRFESAKWEVKSNEIRIVIRKDRKEYPIILSISPSTMLHLGKMFRFALEEIKKKFEEEEEFQKYNYTFYPETTL